jgi:hypothetical protein
MLVRPDELILKLCGTFTLANWIQLSLFMYGNNSITFRLASVIGKGVVRTRAKRVSKLHIYKEKQRDSNCSYIFLQV